MYAKSLGFKQDPFSLDSENGFFYKNANIESTFHQLINRFRIGRGILMLTGEAGAGKSTLLHQVSNKIESEVEFVYRQFGNKNFPELLYGLYNHLELKPKKKDILDDLQLLDNYLSSQQQANLHIAFCIEDAHELKDDVLNKLLLLSTPTFDGTASLQIILTGPRVLERTISKIVLPRSDRFNIVCYSLKSFDTLEVGDYIKQRLKAINYHKELFTPDAILQIAGHSNGLPGEINKICNSALSAAGVGNKLTVTAEIIEQIAKQNQASELMDDGSKKTNHSDHGAAEEPDSVRVQKKLTDIQNKQSVIETVNLSPSDGKKIITQPITTLSGSKTVRQFTWGIAALLVISIGIYYIYQHTVLPLAENNIVNSEEFYPQNNIRIEKDSGDVGRSDEAMAIVKESNKAEEIAEPGVRARQSIIDQERSGQPINLEAIYNQAEESIKKGQPIDAYLLYFYAAKGGYGKASFKLAQLFDPTTFRSGLDPIETPNVAQANKWYLQAAKNGHPKAIHFLKQLRAQITKRAAMGDEKSRRLVLQFQQ